MQTRLTIRKALPSDAAALTRLAERTFRDAYGSLADPVDMELHCARAFAVPIQAREVADEALWTLLAELSGTAVGFAQLRPSPPPPCVQGHQPLELWRFYVDKPWHGQGVAAQLLDSVLTLARQQQGDTLWLGVWDRNPRAQAFYRKHGFAVVGQHPYLFGASLDQDWVMARTWA